jgi:1-phosphatidylinositol-4-phosphate 5-kinase
VGIHNFEAGQGKGGSFFFFSENNVFLVKTMKKSEFDIMFKEGWLVEYHKYLRDNPNSLLARFFGVYEIKINK